MARKCGFMDCNNPTEKKKSFCQNCKERKEQNICSACRQPEPQPGKELNFQNSFFMFENMYNAAEKIRDKVPVQFQSEIDQLLPQLKLSAAEEELLDKMKKLVLDFLAEKGGQQDH